MDSGRPQELIFTLFGEYLLHRPAPVWAGSLIRLLQPLGMSETSARTTLSRMSSREWLKSDRVGRHSYYELTPRGRRLLEAGKDRIYHPDWDKPWSGNWLLLGYSIPEEERVLRDRLRDRLAWLGFGKLRSGLWISPHDVEADVREIAESLEVSGYIDCFHATGAAFTDPERLVQYVQRIRAEHESSSISPEESFVRRFRLTHEYRDFPLIDPYLPRILLPEDWAGECAAHLFRSYHDLLSPPAEEYVQSILASAPEFLPPEVLLETPR